MSIHKVSAPCSPSANMSWILVGRLTDGLMTLALIVLIARYGGSNLTGAYYGARSIGLLALTCAEFGLSRYIVQTFSRKPGEYHKLFGMLLWVRTIAYVITATILLLIAKQISNETNLAIIVPAFILGFMFVSIAELFLDTIRAEENYQIPVVLGAGQKILYVIAGGGGVLMGWGLSWIAGCLVFATAIYMLICVLLVTRSRGIFGWKFSRKLLKPMYAGISPFVVVTILGALNTRADIFVLYRFSTESQVGAYSTTAYLVEALLLLVFAVISSCLPNLSKLFHGAKESFLYGVAATMKLLVVLSLAFMAVAEVCAGDLLEYLYGAEFREFTPLLEIMGYTVVAISINTFMTMLFQAAGQSRRAGLIVAVLVVLHFALSVLLVPKYGALGAVMGLLISEYVVMVVQLSLGRALLPGRRLLVGITKGAFACVGMMVFLVLSEPLNVLVRLIAGFFVFCVFAILLRLFDRPEIKWLRTTAGTTVTGGNQASAK